MSTDNPEPCICGPIDALLTRAKEALEGVTNAPWRTEKNRHPECSGRAWGWIKGPRAHYCWTDDKPGQRADAEFIATARSLVPDLANSLAGLAGAVAEIRARCQFSINHSDPLARDILTILDKAGCP